VKRLLGFHAGIHDKEMRDSIPGGWVEKADDAIALEHLDDICLKHGITGAFAGNWHSFRHWEMFHVGVDRAIDVIQAGTLAPTGWDNPGLDNYGRLVVWQSGARWEAEEIPGPRFLNIDTVADLDHMLADDGWHLYARRTVAPGEAVAAREELAQLEGLAGWDVRVDKTAASEQAQRAAASARSAETLTEALTKWVDEMPLDDDLDRDRIFNMAKGYLT